MGTRTLGRPYVFPGEEARWRDWPTVLRAYSGLCDPQLAVGVLATINTANEADILSITLNQAEEDASSCATTALQQCSFLECQD